MTATVAGLAAAAAAYAAGWLVRRFAADRVLDRPGPRSSHAVARTRLGGVAVVAGLAAGTAAAGEWVAAVAGVAVGAGIAGAAGLAEDLAGFSVAGRLAVQSLAAVAGLSVALTAPAPWVWVVGAFWLVAFTNAFNFMDGIDGLAASQLIVAGLAWLIVGIADDVEVLVALGAAAAGCGLGFLGHNHPPGRIFMGDLGSYAAGFWLAGTAVVGVAAGVPVAAMVAPLVVFAFDASWTLAGRALRGENVAQPHRDHLYQRLVRAGWSHGRATASLAAMSAVAAAAGLVALEGLWPVTLAAAAAVCAGYVFMVRAVAAPAR